MNNIAANAGNAPLVSVGKEPGELNIRGVGTIKVASWDDGLIYDENSLTPTSGTTLEAGTEHVYFRDIQNKDYRQTNMTLSSQLPSGWEMIVLGIGIHLPSSAERADVMGILGYAYGEFVLDNSFTVKSGPLVSFPSGYGLAGHVDVAHTSAIDDAIYQNGTPDKAGIPNLSIPVYISDKRTFRGTIHFYDDVEMSASDASVNVHMYLYGFLKIPAQ